MTRHAYGLGWIDEEELFLVTLREFEKLVAPKKKCVLPPDPFSLVVQTKLLDTTLFDSLSFEGMRSKNKTLTNAVGRWHQQVLGLSPYWKGLGTTGGGVDLKTVDGYLLPRWGKSGYIEVKNRFNTIKASDEKDTWDKLEFLAKSNGAISYLVQIVPEHGVPYDEPWVPSGRHMREDVRHCDGVTGYAMAFERPDALRELYDVLPLIIDDVLVEKGGSATQSLDAREMAELFMRSFPDEPAM